MSKLISSSPDKTIGILGEVDITTESEIKGSVSNARESFKKWGKLGIEEKKQLSITVRQDIT